MAVDNSLAEEDSIAEMVLEPVLVLARLAQISLYPAGTKMFLQDGVFHIQEVSITQSMYRWWNKYSREDLTYLFEPIRRFTTIYKNKTTFEQKEVLNEIIKYSVTGLEKLRDTYSSQRSLDHSLAYYQSFLLQCANLKGTPEIKRTPYLRAVENVRTTSPPPLELSSECVSISKFHDKLSGIWSLEDIRLYRTLLVEVEGAEGEEQRQSHLKTLNSFLETKEIEIKNIMDSIHRP
jgi:hypothetical protein